jgi:hypothetical protein
MHGIEALQFVGMSEDDRQQIIDEIDVENAKCAKVDDQTMILGEILANHGSFKAFNHKLKLLLQLKPLSYRVDLQQLWKRCHTTVWNFEPVRNWLAARENLLLAAQEEGEDEGQGEDGHDRLPYNGEGLSRQQRYAKRELLLWDFTNGDMTLRGYLGLPIARVLCVMGGAGTGKSTVSAAIIRDVLHGSSAVTAEHFCKQTDQRRQEPIGIVKSLVFQLALKLPRLAESLLELGAEIGRSRTLEECCRTLLPLVTAAVTGRDVVILLDALDEADPPEQQRPGFDASKGIQAVGNKALRILLAFLVPQLPKNVRFIITTRPAAVLGGIRAVLDRAFKSDGGGLVRGATCPSVRRRRGRAIGCREELCPRRRRARMQVAASPRGGCAHARRPALGLQ